MAKETAGQLNNALEKVKKSLSITTEGGASGVAYKCISCVDRKIDYLEDKLTVFLIWLFGVLKETFFMFRESLNISTPGGISESMATVMSFIDRAMEAIVEITYIFAIAFKNDWDELREYIWEYKMKALAFFMGMAVVFIGMAVAFNSITGYEYYYNGKMLGYVKNQEDVLRVSKLVSENLGDEYNVDVSISDRDFSFRQISVKGVAVDDTDDVLNRLTYLDSVQIVGAGIFIDNRCVAVVDSVEAGNGILQSIIDDRIKKRNQRRYQKIGFMQNVSVKEIDTQVGRLENHDNVKNLLETGNKQVQVHIVSGDDTVTSIAQKYDLSAREVFELNPDIDEFDLRDGDEIVVSRTSPMLNLRTVEKEIYNEKIDYTVKYFKDSSMFEGSSRITEDGRDGEKKVTAKVVREDGKEISRTVISSQVIKEPRERIVIKGTKERPPTVGDGHLINPCPDGYQSSSFGMRWGSLHRGVDLACDEGCTIMAADGGTVITASYNDSYGNFVEIDHMNGMITRYAHCSKLCVEPGDRVYQGQKIAESGNTGHSTGPHCHVEVEVDGVLKNPRNYF